MTAALLSTTQLYSMMTLKGAELAQMLRYAARTQEGLRVAVVTDNAPIPAKAALLEALQAHCQVEIFDQVQPNPRTEDIQAMVQDSRYDTCHIVLGIGGGSVMDSAKAMAMLKANGGMLEEYLGLTPTRAIEKRSIPLVLVPTTAGTGSEMTKVGVYTDKTGRKHTLGSPLMSAYAAFLVASLLDSMPLGLCASTGLDALDHALESLWNKNSTPLTREVSRSAAIQVLSTLGRLYDAIESGSRERRALQMTMLEASAEAGIAFNMTGTAAGHAISFILSEQWHIPHGLACAFTLLDIFDWAMQEPENREEIALLSSHFHSEQTQADALVQLLRKDIEQLMQHLHIPRTFSELSLHPDRTMIEQCFKRSLDDPKLHNQTPPLSEASLYALLEKKL